MISSNAIPENIRRRMQPETRRELKAPTQDEADAKFIARREKELQENIARLLTQRGITFFRQRMDRKTTGTVGWPDFTFAVNGKACACEVKVPGGRISPDQQNVLNALMAEGWAVCVVNSESLFLTWLNVVQGEVTS